MLEYLLLQRVMLQQTVDAIDYPAEESSVQCLSHSVSDISSFVDGVGPYNRLPSSDHTVGGESFL